MKWLLIFIFTPYCLSEGGVVLKMKWKERDETLKVSLVCLDNEDVRIPIYKGRK